MLPPVRGRLTLVRSVRPTGTGNTTTHYRVEYRQRLESQLAGFEDMDGAVRCVAFTARANIMISWGSHYLLAGGFVTVCACHMKPPSCDSTAHHPRNLMSEETDLFCLALISFCCCHSWLTVEPAFARVLGNNTTLDLARLRVVRIALAQRILKMRRDVYPAQVNARITLLDVTRAPKRSWMSVTHSKSPFPPFRRPQSGWFASNICEPRAVLHLGSLSKLSRVHSGGVVGTESGPFPILNPTT